VDAATTPGSGSPTRASRHGREHAQGHRREQARDHHGGQQDIELKQSLPDIIRFAAAGARPSTAELRLAYEYVRWSVFKNQCVLDASDPDAQLQDPPTGAVDKSAGGAGVILNIAASGRCDGLPPGRIDLARPSASRCSRASATTQRRPRRDARAPSLMDMTSSPFSLGTRIDVAKHMALGDPTPGLLLDRTIAPRQRDASGKPMTPDAPSRARSAGTYSQPSGCSASTSNSSSDPMEKRTLGQGLSVSAIGLGAWGCRSSTGRPTRRSRRHAPSRARARDGFSRYGGMYGPFKNESRRQGHPRPARPGILATKFGIVRGEDNKTPRAHGKPEYARSACEASLKRSASTTSISYYLTARTRTCRSRTPSVRWPIWCGRARCGTSGCRRCRRKRIQRAHKVHPTHGGAGGVLAVDARDREGSVLDTLRALGSGCRLQPARARVPHRRHHDVRRSRPRTTALFGPASPATPAARTSPIVRGSIRQTVAAEKGCVPRSWRWHGCSARGGPTWCPFRGGEDAPHRRDPRARPALRRALKSLRRPPSSSTIERSSRSIECRR